MTAATLTHIRELVPNAGFKCIKVELATTADDGDTYAITLATYGMKTFEAIEGWIHTTEDSVVVAEAPTTAVSAGVLTITVGGSTDNKKRVYLVYGDSV